MSYKTIWTIFALTMFVLLIGVTLISSIGVALVICSLITLIVIGIYTLVKFESRSGW